MIKKSFQVFSSLEALSGRRELAEALALEIDKFSIVDLQHFSARLEREISLLPLPYRENIRPFFLEQYFGRYQQIQAMESRGELGRLTGEIRDLRLFREYCGMITARFPTDPVEDEGDDLYDAPFNSLFYYLICGFHMFVLDEPGHPVGMPFPGGFTVQSRDGAVFCPIRDKEKDVEYSICNFCPAKQDEVLR